MALRVLVAPDSFKGSIRAADAARAFAAGWLEVRPGDLLDLAPMADGGEGTIDAVATAVPGARRRALLVPGPLGAPIEADWLLLPDGTGLVELASTSGLELAAHLDPLGAHTRGLGVAIAAALRAGVPRLVVALGGSASTDGGLGALRALGALALDEAGHELADGGGALARLAELRLPHLLPPPPEGVRLLTDVGNPLLGARGAAAVFGPQKGADPAQVALLEAGLARLARHLAADPWTPGAGAAGGTAFGLLAWGGRIESGAATLAALLEVPARTAAADLVVTGEGRFDGQTAEGKAPAIVLAAARAAGVPAALVAGSIGAEPDGFVHALSLTELVGSAARAIGEPAAALTAAGRALAARQSLPGRVGRPLWDDPGVSTTRPPAPGTAP